MTPSMVSLMERLLTRQKIDKLFIIDTAIIKQLQNSILKKLQNLLLKGLKKMVLRILLLLELVVPMKGQIASRIYK